MDFIIQRDNIYNALNSAVRVTATRGVQPVLSNVLIETISSDRIRIVATDLDLSIELKTSAMVNKQGSITLPAKKLIEIISKLPNNPVNFVLNDDNFLTSITCGNSKFDLKGIPSSEFPDINCEIESGEVQKALVEINPFLKAIKQTVYAAAVYDTNNVLSGAFCKITDNKLEMAATDGNRLARVIEGISGEEGQNFSVIIPSKTLGEFAKMATFLNEDKVQIGFRNGQIIFKFEDGFLASRLLDGQYPKYEQLIPSGYSKAAKVKRDELISALERTSTMVNERTSIIKFTFNDNKLLLKADTPDLGDSMDLIDAEYTYEELSIAFNYKYVLDSIRTMETENIIVDLEQPLSATIFKPDSEDEYICLVMPVQIR